MENLKDKITNKNKLSQIICLVKIARNIHYYTMLAHKSHIIIIIHIGLLIHADGDA